MTAGELYRMAEIWRWLAQQTSRSEIRAILLEWAERCVLFAERLPLLRELASREIRPLFGATHHA